MNYTWKEKNVEDDGKKIEWVGLDDFKNGMVYNSAGDILAVSCVW